MYKRNKFILLSYMNLPNSRTPNANYVPPMLIPTKHIALNPSDICQTDLDCRQFSLGPDGPVQWDMSEIHKDFEGVCSKVSSKHFDFLVASHNVLTLSDEVSDMSDTGLDIGRRGILMETYATNNFFAVGIQEGRHREQLSAACEHYHLFTSGADKGNYGCELWVSKQISYMKNGTSTTTDILSNQFCVVCAEPRILAVALCNSNCSFNFLVVHAPHSKKTYEEVKDFWDHVVDVVKSFRNNAQMVWLMDANASVGQQVSNSIGNHCASIECRAGKLMHDVLKTFSMFLPSTFSELHDSSQAATWHSKRLDYIAIQLDQQHRAITAGTIPKSDFFQLCLTT